MTASDTRLYGHDTFVAEVVDHLWAASAGIPLLAEEIRSDGPISFRRFMDVALYHPQHGYYRRHFAGKAAAHDQSVIAHVQCPLK